MKIVQNLFMELSKLIRERNIAVVIVKADNYCEQHGHHDYYCNSKGTIISKHVI